MSTGLKNFGKDVALILIATIVWSSAIDLAGGNLPGWTWRSIGVWILLCIGGKVYGAANYWHPAREQS